MGYSPFFLLFARSPRLPIDVALGIQDAEGGIATTRPGDYAEKWQEQNETSLQHSFAKH